MQRHIRPGQTHLGNTFAIYDFRSIYKAPEGAERGFHRFSESSMVCSLSGYFLHPEETRWGMG